MSTKEGLGSNKFGRAAGIAFGVGTQFLFAFTVWYLFWFLRDGPPASDHPPSFLRDVILALQFAIVHSLLLLPAVRNAIVTRGLPSALYGSLFCVATCLGLLLICGMWESSQQVLWDLQGWGRGTIRAAFYGSWGALLFSISHTGLGYQTGLTPWWYWVRRQVPPRRGFATHGLYQWFRHPVYLSFLGLIWFTPRMSWDHALLTGIWTVYIFLGSFLKDERLAHYLGDTYREYQSRVPGYPAMWFGPLGLRPRSVLVKPAGNAFREEAAA